jgi:hypothetical protein
MGGGTGAYSNDNSKSMVSLFLLRSGQTDGKTTEYTQSGDCRFLAYIPFQCTLQLRGQIHSSYFSLLLYALLREDREITVVPLAKISSD